MFYINILPTFAMGIRFVLKIKDEHNPPVFKEGFEKGELIYQDVDVPDFDENNIRHIGWLMEFQRQLIENHIEVEYKIIN